MNSRVDVLIHFGSPEGRQLYRSPTFLACLLVLLFSLSLYAQQSQEEPSDALRGTVINSITREPISRALVYSPDNRFATLTDAQGRFEFLFPAEQPQGNADYKAGTAVPNSNRPYMLTARKPGFLIDPSNEAQGVQLAPQTREVTLALVPEALIVGHISLPGSEAPDKVALELYRREVRDGLSHWAASAVATSNSSGEFRFAELQAGTYKLFTRELPDSDAPNLPGKQQFAYTPVYFPNVSDFASAAEIELTPGKVVQADLSPTRQPYFPVRIPVLNVQPGTPLNVIVSMQGRRGPGYALEFNAQEQRIEGALPNGNFTLEASGEGQSGVVNIVVRGAAVEGPAMVAVPGRSINVNVKEEFTTNDQTSGSYKVFINNRRSITARGPRSYLNVNLEPAEDFDQHSGGSLRDPVSRQDDALVLDAVQPGRYWVRVTSSRGYASSVTSGGTDLLHRPLAVGIGGVVSPIEITMRDDTAQVDGTVEGLRPDPADSTGAPDRVSGTPLASAHVYCIPVEESSGQFTALPVSADGKIFPFPLPPGTYRVLAFTRPQPNLEYRNPEAMRAYDGKGPVVRLVAGQTEHLRIPLMRAE